MTDLVRPAAATASTPTMLAAKPPDRDHWSVLTLARHLCVKAAAVDARLNAYADEDPETPVFVSARFGARYKDQRGEPLIDSYVMAAAAERVANEFPIGLLARQVAADEPEMAALLGWDQIHAMARHIVEMAEGAT